MTTVKRFSCALSFTLFVIVLTAHAQTPRVSTVNVKAEAGRVRVSSEGDVFEMRVEVTDEQGEVVFQSGQITDNSLDWTMADARGERVAPGTYLVTVTYRASSGKLRKRVEQVTVEEAVTTPSAQAPTGPAPAATTSPVPVKASGSVTVGRLAKFTGLTSTGATVADSGIIESAGKIGIGTTTPASRLTVVAATPIAVQADNPATAVGASAVQGKITSTSPGSGSAGVRGINNSTGPNGYGIYGTHAGSGIGVVGTATSGIGVQGSGGVRAGVLGTTTDSNGSGVEGNASGDNAAGVFGVNTAGVGVWGRGTQGAGVYGESDVRGVHGVTTYASGSGVEGNASGGNAAGVFGVNPSGPGVWGRSTSGSGVYGESNLRGVYGASTASGGTGVYGTSNNGRAIWGVSSSSFGVEGDSTSNVGVAGFSSTNNGVQGVSNSSTGVFGQSTSGAGVAGQSSGGPGVQGVSNSGTGVVGQSTSGFAGFFIGKVQVNGSLTVNGNVCASNHPCSSDARLKVGIAGLNYGLRHLLQLRPVSWKWKEEPEGNLQLGLVAQEVESVMPELVLREADATRPLGLNYMALLPVAVKAIQEQQAQIKQQAAQIERQGSQIEALTRTVERQQAQLNQVRRTIRGRRARVRAR